jgi:hypothetical protein
MHPILLLLLAVVLAACIRIERRTALSSDKKIEYHDCNVVFRTVPFSFIIMEFRSPRRVVALEGGSGDRKPALASSLE